jgi:hypothetical protein
VLPMLADDLAHGRAASFAAIARREGKVERHVRLLAPLAFVSPRIVAAILDATAPAGLAVTALARALPWSWAEQERQMEIASLSFCWCGPFSYARIAIGPAVPKPDR